jgi:WD40 repeat protein
MTPNRGDQVYAVFEAALKCEPAGRAARLDELCTADPDLRAEVERLLAQDEQASRDRFLAPTGAAFGRALLDAPTAAPDPGATGPPPAIDTGATGPPGDSTLGPPPSPHDRPTTVGFDPAATADSPAAEPVRIRYFGDYELISEIARGGMGVVFRARQMSLNRPVALKMILAGQLADAAEVRRFYLEAEAAANLDHPGIVPIFEVGQHEGQHYFSMGYVEGQSLARKMAHGPLPPRQAAELVRQVAEAVQYAHKHGIIHRDLKPANVLLDTQGRPRITDFGLAKKVQGESGLTASGQLMGTPSYMPPEQAGGKVGPASDVYALGATLYALITGRPPFQAATAMDTVLQVLNDEPVPPRRLNASVPRDLDVICLKCLEKEPGNRYASAAALAEDLRRYLVGEPIRARPVGRAGRAWRWCRRNPVVAGLAGGIALALVMGAVVATLFALRAREEKRTSDRRLYIAEMNLAQRAWQEGNLDLFQARLKAYQPKRPDDPDLRGFEWYYLDRLRNLELRTLGQLDVRGRGNSGASLAYSPDGRILTAVGPGGLVTLWDDAREHTFSLRGYTRGVKRLAYSPDGRTLAAAGEGTVRLWDTATGSEVQTLRGHASMALDDVAYSPDGRTLAAANGRGIVQLWDTATWKEVRTLGGLPYATTVYVTYSPDGRTLTLAHADGTVKFWDAATGREVRTLRGHAFTTVLSIMGGINTPLAYSPDGRTLAVAGSDGTVALWDTAAGKEVRTLHGHAGLAMHVAYSPDGRTLAAASISLKDQTATLWDIATGKEVLTLHGRWYVPSMVYSPDGRTLASASGDQTVTLWDPATGKVVRTLRCPRGAIEVAYSPDGRTLALVTSNNTVEVWDANTAEEPVILRGHSGTVARVAYSPDGRTLASASGDRTIKLWDAATGKEVQTLRGHAGAVLGVAYSPDGRALASASEDRTVKIWDVATGKEARILTGQHEDGVSGVVYSPDGVILASASADNTVKLWDPATGYQVRTLRGHPHAVDCLAYSPDGRTLVSAGADGTVKLWSFITRERLRSRFARRRADGTAQNWDDITDVEVQELRTRHGTVQVHDSTKGQLIEVVPRAAGRAYNGIVAYSPDGHTLAATSLIGVDDNTAKLSKNDSGTVKLWDMITGQEVLTLHGHANEINGVAFSPDGRRLASASTDGTVKLWDTITGQEVLTLRGHANEINGVAFSPDGYQIACACGDGTVEIWDATPLTPELRTAREARSIVEFYFARNLPAAEVLARIRRDPTIREEVCQRALDLAEPRRAGSRER